MGFYSLVGFLRPAIYIFLLPLYISYFSAAEYGIYNLMIDVAAIAMILASLKINTAMMTHYYDYMGDEHTQFRYLQNLYTGCLLIGSIFLLSMYFMGPWIFEHVFKDDAITFFPYGMTVMAYAMLFEATQVYLTYLKNKKNIWRFTFIMLFHVISIVVLQFIFIIVLERGVKGALESVLIGNILVTMLVMIMQPRLLTFKLDFKMIISSLTFSIMLVPYLVIYWFLTRGGRIFLESYTDLDTVAVFGLLMVLSGVIILAVEAVVNGVRPFLFEQFAQGAHANDKTISILSKMVVNIPLLFVPIIILVSCFIHLISSEAIYATVPLYMPAACLLWFAIVISRLFYQQLLFAKKSHTVTILSFVTVSILIAGFMYLIPRYEIWGVIVATIIANSVMALLFYLFAQKAWYVHYSYISIILSPALVFASIFILQYLSNINGWSIQTFGWLQFVVALFIILVMNVGNVREYMKVFKNGDVSKA